LATHKLRIDRLCYDVARTAGDGRRRTQPVLRDVSFAVGEGEAFGVIGPSGSGKTTLLRLLNGLESPDGGSVLLDGQDISGIDPQALRRRIGMVFQVPALFAGTVSRNVTYPLDLRSTPVGDVQERGRRCLARAGLPEDFWNRDAALLSQGERQRVAIARALAADPEVLLLDEPTSALDPSAASRILRLARSLNEDDGVTVVFVTHLMNQARVVCGRAMVLIEGRGVEEGDIPALFEHPGNELTRRFLEGSLEPEGLGSCGGGAQ
jgi:D-methionine transport system ATP-binding protein